MIISIRSFFVRVIILIFILALITAILGPFIYSLGRSLNTPSGISLSSYKSILQDNIFRISLYNSIIYTICTVIGQLMLGIFCAYMIEKFTLYKRDSMLLLIAFFLPYTIPTAIIVLSWNFLLESNGLFAQFFSLFGIPNSYWKSNYIIVSLIIVSIWAYFPFVFLSLLARIKKIPIATYNSAQLDGANGIRLFFKVTLPVISHTLLIILLLRIAFMFTKFDLPWYFMGNKDFLFNLIPTFIGKRAIYINVENKVIASQNFAIAVTTGVTLLIICILIFIFLNSIIFKKAKYSSK